MTKIHNLLKNNNEPIVMGILNVTPDSFFDGGKFNNIDSALIHSEKMIAEGAHIIDIGAESSRPGAEAISVSEERLRLEPILIALRKEFSIPISIDTYKPEIMKIAIDYGADMINDIFALQRPGAIDVVSSSDIHICLMHMQGDPKSMQKDPTYSDIFSEVNQFLKNRISFCEKNGIIKERLFVDPGFGFGKTFEDNIKLFNSINKFEMNDVPLLIGFSRKSMIKKIVDGKKELICGLGSYMAVKGIIAGARVIRTHDVKETVVALNKGKSEMMLEEKLFYPLVGEFGFYEG